LSGACHVNADDGGLEEGGHCVRGEQGLDSRSAGKAEPEDQIRDQMRAVRERQEGEGRGNRDKRRKKGTTLGSRHCLVGLEP